MDNDDVFSLIAGLRGGWPDVCDWCEKPFGDSRPVPEEAGEWVCYDCFMKEWRAHQKGPNEQT